MVAGGISSARNKVMSGKTVAQIAAIWKCQPEEAVIRLLAEEDAAVGRFIFRCPPMMLRTSWRAAL